MKKVLITGGSRGIGAEAVRQFCKNGYSVTFTYEKNDEKAAELAKETGTKAIKCDVSDYVEVKKANFTDIDILINNAGIAQQKLFTDITEDDWDRMFDVNIKGMFNVTKAVLPDMIHNKWGRIINLSSMWGITGASCEVHYSASKAAVIGFTRALAKEVGPSGITVNCIAPGVIDTDMNKGFDVSELKEETPLQRIGKVTDIVPSMLFLASDDASFITGQILGINGGIVI